MLYLVQTQSKKMEIPDTSGIGVLYQHAGPGVCRSCMVFPSRFVSTALRYAIRMARALIGDGLTRHSYHQKLPIAPALRPDANSKLPIGLQLKVVIFLMICVGAMGSGVQATPKQWGLSRIGCLVNPTPT